MFSVLPRKYYFEGSGTGKLVSVDKYATEISSNSSKSEKKGIPQTYYLFFQKHSTGMNRSIRIISGVAKSSIQMASALDLAISG